jgi:hypothetical protein
VDVRVIAYNKNPDNTHTNTPIHAHGTPRAPVAVQALVYLAGAVNARMCASAPRLPDQVVRGSHTRSELDGKGGKETGQARGVDAAPGAFDPSDYDVVTLDCSAGTIVVFHQVASILVHVHSQALHVSANACLSFCTLPAPSRATVAPKIPSLHGGRRTGGQGVGRAMGSEPLSSQLCTSPPLLLVSSPSRCLVVLRVTVVLCSWRGFV